MRPVLSLFMKIHDSAIDDARDAISGPGATSTTVKDAPPRPRGRGTARGLAWGLLGVAGFSMTVPLTRISVEAIPALFIASGRAVVAAVIAGTVLLLTRQRLPRGRQWGRIAVVAAGVVLGFPLLTSYALTMAPAGRSALVIGLLPAATAVTVVLRTGERPPRRFWAFAAAGAVSAVVLVWFGQGSIAPPGWADLMLFGAVVAAALGYAEGGALARELGAWQTVSWALVMSVPVMGALTVWSLLDRGPWDAVAAPGWQHWVSFGYLAIVSMYLAFFAWYRGLAIGPMTQVSQIQLAQPILSLIWAALLLGEQITLAMVAAGGAVILCAWCAVRTRHSDRPKEPADEAHADLPHDRAR